MFCFFYMYLRGQCHTSLFKYGIQLTKLCCSSEPYTHGKTHTLLQHSTALISGLFTQDNVATPVTAMMVTVCISTDALSSVFISPDLSDTNSFHQCCWSIIPVTVRSQHTCTGYSLYHSVISDWYSPDNPTDCYQLCLTAVNSLIQLWYHICIMPEGATGCNRSVAFLRVYTGYINCILSVPAHAQLGLRLTL